jgi:phosphoadenosine phosphosulfate reductase
VTIDQLSIINYQSFIDPVWYAPFENLSGRFMHITMVKKRLANGEPCAKCQQSEDRLRDRGVWDQINDVVWADETDAESPGMLLGAKHGVELAPFFIVREDDGSEIVYTQVLKFMKERFPKTPAAAPSQGTGAVEPLDFAALHAELEPKGAQEIVRWALERYGADCAIAFSGAEDVVLVDLAAKTGLPFSVFCLDTGRLHPQTYHFIERVRDHYGIEIRVMSPDREALEAFVREKGLFSFYQDGHKGCCGVRKIAPLRRALGDYGAWIAGIRRDQSPDTRAAINVIELDQAFKGRDGDLVKFNPVANWTSAQVWHYIRSNDVPYNELHDQGYISIGCEPCTRAIRPGEHERAARWWWEDSTKRECGLHVKE